MRKILVIEDDPAINRLLSLSFKDDLDTQVDFAQDYLRGLSMALEKPYDLFLVDLNLDSHSGLDLIRKISEQGPLDNRIIVISANISRENRIKGFKLGVSNFIQKPIDMEILKAVMKKNLRMLDRNKGLELSFAGLSLVPGQLSATYDNKGETEQIKLSPTEYRILEALVLQRGNIVQKETILFMGRDQNKELSNASIEVHVSSLRRKLVKVNAPSIASKWGVGYYIEQTNVLKVA